MARVEVRSQAWGTLWDRAGNVQVGMLAAINTTVYAAATGGTTIAPAAFVTDVNGALPGFVDEGDWALTVAGVVLVAPAVSGSLPPRVGSLESTRPLTTAVWVRSELPPYITPAGDAGDQTAQITAALAEGRTLYLPKGIYRVQDLVPPGEGLTIQGEGCGLTDGTRLKGLGGAAAYVIKNQGKRFNTFANLIIDGNGRATRGMLTESTAGATSQNQRWRDLQFYRCTTGLHIGNAGLTQADKNSLYDTAFVECSTSLWNESLNGQATILHNCIFQSLFDIGIRLTAGDVKMIGGMFQNESAAGKRCIVFDGANIDVLDLDGVITEAVSHAIDGTSAWPEHGVIVRGGTVLQGTLSNVKMPANARLTASDSTFNIGNVIALGADPVFVDNFTKWTNGAIFDTSAATGFVRRNRWTLNGLDDGTGQRTVGAGGQPAFAAGWAALGGGAAPLRFEKRPEGSIRVTGAVLTAAGVAANAAIFTLPAERPLAGYFRFPCVTSAGALGIINVTTAGVVSTNLVVGAGVALFIDIDIPWQ